MSHALRKITKKALLEEFGRSGDVISDYDAEHVAQLTSESQLNDRERQDILEIANKAIHGHGIEEIRGTKAESLYGRRFFGDAVAVYVNTGDTYTPTVLYDVIKRKFYLTSFGDFVEKYDKAYGIDSYQPG